MLTRFSPARFFTRVRVASWLGAWALIVFMPLARPVALARPQPPQVGVKALDPKSLLGTWKGQSMEDGELTLVFGPGDALSYAFSGGQKWHAKGKFKLADGGLLFFTPAGETEAEQWLLLMEVGGKKITLDMEEDNPDDEETIELSKP